MSPEADALRIARARAVGRELGIPETRTEQQPEQRAFGNWLLRGSMGLRSEEQQVLQRHSEERRTMVSTGGAYPGSGDGYFAPAQFEANVWLMLKQYDQLFDAATIVETPRGGLRQSLTLMTQIPPRASLPKVSR